MRFLLGVLIIGFSCLAEDISHDIHSDPSLPQQSFSPLAASDAQTPSQPKTEKEAPKPVAKPSKVSSKKTPAKPTVDEAPTQSDSSNENIQQSAQIVPAPENVQINQKSSEVASFKKGDDVLITTQNNFTPKENNVSEISDRFSHALGWDKRYVSRQTDQDSNRILNLYSQKKLDGFEEPVANTPIPQKKLFSNDEKLNLGAIGKKRISINLTEDVSVKDAIIEVSRLSGVDIELDPRVDGSIILVLKNKPVEEVLDRIARLANLRKSVDGGVVRLEADIPFMMSYNLNFLDMSRNSAITTFTNSGVGNNNNMPGSNQINNMQQNGQNQNGQMRTNNVASQQPQSNSLSIQNHASMWDSFEAGLKQIIAKRDDTEYSINKQAGIVTIMAPLTVHKVIAEYMDKVKKNSTAQILIEVRVVEVTLKDEFRTGINFNSNDGIFAATLSSISGLGASTASDPKLGARTSSSLTSAIQFLQTFGSTRTLSSPRLNVMNNQPAVISFAKDQVYFQLTPTIQNQYSTASTVSNPTTPIVLNSTTKTIPVGVTLSLQAIADTDTQEITMNVHPSITSSNETVADPSASFMTQYIQNVASTGSNANVNTSSIVNNIPVVSKKELDSVLRIKSGQIMVIGGFNSEQAGVSESGIPFLKDIPFLGRFFSSKTNYINNIETVIFIKASIMQTENPISKQDAEFNRKFS